MGGPSALALDGVVLSENSTEQRFLEIRFDARTKKQHVRRKALPDPDTVWVFAWLGHRKGQRDRFFVLTHRGIQTVVYEHYTRYLRKHGGRRPQAPESRHTAIALAALEPFESAWQLVEDQLLGRSQSG